MTPLNNNGTADAAQDVADIVKKNTRANSSRIFEYLDFEGHTCSASLSALSL